MKMFYEDDLKIKKAAFIQRQLSANSQKITQTKKEYYRVAKIVEG
jgi:hypothetical protein